MVYWLYDDTEGLVGENVRGCPGKDCMRIHELMVTDIDAEAEEELRNELADKYNVK